MKIKNITYSAAILFFLSFLGYNIYRASTLFFWILISAFVCAVAYFAYSKFKQTQRPDSFYTHRD